ncbi:MAG: hypothetical protein IJK89_06620 [Clostridia bacterium]|nr:hypothetical protein [Clostridia bacterium]
MQDLIIVCAGGFGLEAAAFIEKSLFYAAQKGEEAPFRILGFLDDNPDALEGTGVDYPVLGSISDWQPIGNERYVLGAASPSTKEKLSAMLKARGCRFETIIAPWCIILPETSFGEGCIISAYRICSGVKLGDFVNVAGSMLCPGAEIGDFSTTTGFTVVENARIGKRVFIGSHAVVTDGVVVGDDAQISAGTIVREDVRSGATVFGCPAREI